MEPPSLRKWKDLKGNYLQPKLGGYQEDEKRSSRERNVEEPVVMLNHYWNISEKTTLNTNLGYQFGHIGNSRLDYGSNQKPGWELLPAFARYFPPTLPPTIINWHIWQNRSSK